ncbi:hypothetical protein BaRGS_00014086 [Batillaria attramentaria]|uniref:Uncharacterized protein n=1 Tax=Batillaria attramentaria TaxID=370345 RepID=A0ABD0L631_9CAEN
MAATGPGSKGLLCHAKRQGFTSLICMNVIKDLSISPFPCFRFLMVLFVIAVIVLSSCYRHQKTKTRRVAVVTTVHVPPHQQQANPYPTPQTHPPPQPYGDPAYPPGYGMGQGPPPADNPFQKAAYN